MNRLGSRASAVLLAGLVSAGAASVLLATPLPAPPVPPQNPITEAKRVLGKTLFWDEQLSTDNTMSCGTCHIPSAGGTDPRVGLHPGNDGLFGTPDDRHGSPGVVAADAEQNFNFVTLYGTAKQVTPRAANSNLMAAYAPRLFWDGRAEPGFVDPQTGLLTLFTGAALESQAVAPLMNDVEMSHAERDWDEIVDKLASARPLALASALPPDVAAVLEVAPTYPKLFSQAFGSEEITAAKIAMALATYQRTLAPDRTPWDLFQKGQTSALTPQQTRGWQAIQANGCTGCHTPPQFTDHSFHNIGVTPSNDDLGRGGVTGIGGLNGNFKTPSLRNAGLKHTYMHGGQIPTLTDVIRFYVQAPGSRPMVQNVNLDARVRNIRFPAQVAADIEAFIEGGLTDPRVAQEEFPFDRPAMFSERPSNPSVLPGGGVPGLGGFVPRIIAVSPPLLGEGGFRIGLSDARGDCAARLVLSDEPPVGGKIPEEYVAASVYTTGADAGTGTATAYIELPRDGRLDKRAVYAQWVIDDPAAPGRRALSSIVELELVCGRGECPPRCIADHDANQVVDLNDYFAFLGDFFAESSIADADTNFSIDIIDYYTFMRAYFEGC